MSEYLFQNDHLRSTSVLRRALGVVASFFGQTAEEFRSPAEVFAGEPRRVVELQALLAIVAADYQEQRLILGEKAPSNNIALLTITSPGVTISDTYKELTLDRALIKGDCAMYLNRQSPELPNSCETISGVVHAPAKKLLEAVRSVYGLRTEFGKSAQRGIDAAQESLILRFHGAYLNHRKEE